MGVLDDAIREHLDLKRRHGASDEELTRQEAEALGPARREAPEAEPESDVEPAAEAAAVEPAPPVHEDELGAEELEEHEPPEAALPPSGPEAPVAPEEEPDPDFGAEAPDEKPPRDYDFD
jgi:hypothetical protein